jgi:hypothetical protein
MVSLLELLDRENRRAKRERRRCGGTRRRVGQRLRGASPGIKVLQRLPGHPIRMAGIELPSGNVAVCV